jgi:hypothetical protein
MPILFKKMGNKQIYEKKLIKEIKHQHTIILGILSFY